MTSTTLEAPASATTRGMATDIAEAQSEKSEKQPTDLLYDIIVIGAGSGGLSVALPLHEFGLRVLLIDKADAAIGGDCLNDGCVPSKALIHAARAVHQARQARRFGVEVQGEVDMASVNRFIQERQEIIRQHENAGYFRRQGMDVALGTARFVDKDQVEVEGTRYRGRKILIATGSRPRKLTLPGVEQVRYLTNKSIFDLQHLPPRLLVVGGGPIGIEMAQAFSRLGTAVTVLHNKPMILDKEAEEIASILHKRLEAEGIRFVLEAESVKLTDAHHLVIKTRQGTEETLAFDELLVSIGRELNTEQLDLPRGGIATDEDGIVVNEYLQTTNKQVYVCGDIAGSLKFSHAAEQQATVLLNNFLSPFKKKLDNRHMSWVTFTDPEVATFGYSEQHLKEKKVSYEKLSMDLEEDDRAVIEEYQYGKLILYIEKSSLLNRNPKVLGGSMIAPHAGEIFQELVLANTHKIGINAFFEKIYAYPTAATVNKRIVMTKKRQQLTPLVKKLFQFLYKI
ncbi:dihydrolipoyl dehydrogenase family protein [Telluribacter sp.]|jgi:pyruvate/2-oxoglutarate dehydrogenase complex dihydrolipoamide dehydrogenase (E3) component|uniref:dihydrolipoyl dehydrogenase family protein n=1 Tax=Telluribacter sp. TaxID=1978767 RepID=UPI002E12E4D9|nr:FAD-dependent oxidoreductase [Telluribacter sp.]